VSTTDLADERWPAPAKLNLFLHITGRRADGYHELQTLFQLLDWGDELQIIPRPHPNIGRVGPDYGVPVEQDLAIRAARLLQAETGRRLGAEIRVTKNVPMGSGMGGGSSDAATVLLVLNRMWGCGLDIDQLAALGARLGADVPVFVRGRTAMASGIGERLEPVDLGARHYVLVFPGISIATSMVFSDPALKRDSGQLGLDAVLAGKGRNDCEAVVKRRFPAMLTAFHKLSAWGHPVMTGTGSGIFLFAENAASAKRSAKQIKNLYNSRAVRGVDRSPVHEKLYTGGM
jgi:4-diphosphocytidyl-2-C-methyl-D-erythritol kinase